MNITPRLETAIARVTQLHEGQFRKDGTTPYVEHLQAVAEILSHYTDDEDVVIADLFHDALEDVDGYEYENLENEYGKRIADIVEGVTQIKITEDSRYRKDLPREEKVPLYEENFLAYVQKIENAGEEAILVKAADLLHNLRTMLETYQTHGPEFLKNFNQPLPQKIRQYGNLIEMLSRHVSPELSTKLKDIHQKAIEVLGENSKND